MTRRRWVAWGAVSAAAALAYPTLLETQWLELTETSIAVPKRQARKPFRILHLADFHASFAVPQVLIERAIRIGLEQHPQLALLTGDFITSRHGFAADTYIQALKKLAAAAPTYAVLGNHDGGKWANLRGGFSDHAVVEDILSSSGVNLLHNKSTVVKAAEEAINLVGVGDLWSEEIDAEAAFRHLQGDLPTILLSHNPDSKSALAAYPWDLMLCGHTHGGQVIIPFEGPKYAPVQDKAYVAGLKPWRDRQLYVTRGVGSLGSVRFRCRPEVTILNLT